MSNNEKLTEVLNDLIRINHDRAKGYEKSAEDIENSATDFRQMFNEYSQQSSRFAAQLTNEVQKYGGDAADGTTTSGKIHRAWIDVKATFTGKDKESILSSCEFGEDAAQKAYKDALSSDAQMPADTRKVISDQQSELKSAHDKIKRYRDAAKTVDA